MIYIILFVSLLLDYVFLSLISNNSLLFPLFTLVSLILIYPLFKEHQFNRYLIISFCLGIVYDVVYMNTIFLNIGSFLLFPYLIKYFFKNFSVNIINNILITILLIIIYRTITFLV